MKKLTKEELAKLDDRAKAAYALRAYTGLAKLQIVKRLEEMNAGEIAALASAAERGSGDLVRDVVDHQATREKFEAIAAKRSPVPVPAPEQEQEEDTVILPE